MLFITILRKIKKVLNHARKSRQDDGRHNLFYCSQFWPSQMPYRVSLAETGIEAIEKIKAGNYDLVLMDVRMPDLGGIEAAQAIRRGEVGQDKVGIKMIALTAYALKGDRERRLAAGMDEYLTKPLKSEELYGMLQNFNDAES
ncbi:MAG: response regulator [Desulfovibrionaceae bacterium]|nr:response regulator [Desulfovibrionaceae bacterium]MBF0512434.1 response regulator [Desulfovibrionaceae bacterium]